MWADELKAGRVKVHPAHPKLGDVVGAVGKELEPLFAGERTARDAAGRAASAVNGILQSK